jgi:hypothetical protein
MVLPDSFGTDRQFVGAMGERLLESGLQRSEVLEDIRRQIQEQFPDADLSGFNIVQPDGKWLGNVQQVDDRWVAFDSGLGFSAESKASMSDPLQALEKASTQTESTWNENLGSTGGVIGLYDAKRGELHMAFAPRDTDMDVFKQGFRDSIRASEAAEAPETPGAETLAGAAAVGDLAATGLAAAEPAEPEQRRLADFVEPGGAGEITSLAPLEEASVEAAGAENITAIDETPASLDAAGGDAVGSDWYDQVAGGGFEAPADGGDWYSALEGGGFAAECPVEPACDIAMPEPPPEPPCDPGCCDC